MKKIITQIIYCLTLISFSFAQIPPQAFNYSAVARNPVGQPISNATIGIQITILKTSSVGNDVYKENHFVNTDDFGLFNLIIGAGAVQSGGMNSITWSNDNYYLKVGMDANGGNNFLTMGTVQLLSVPYALHSATADSVIGLSSNNIYLQEGNNVNITGTGTQLDPYIVNSTFYIQAGNNVTLTGTGSQADPFIVNASVVNNSIVVPTVTTDPVTNIGTNTATFGGSVSNTTNEQIISRGILVSSSPRPTVYSMTSGLWSGSGIGSFDTTLVYDMYAYSLIPNRTYYVRAYAITENNNYFYGNEVTFTTNPVGQIGPGGGFVFFDKGNNVGGWQYLEVAGSDQSSGAGWGCQGQLIGATGYIDGETNTPLIVAGCTQINIAAKLCDDLILGGQNDWFLPSFQELYLLYMNLHINGIGSFLPQRYWTSTEIDADMSYTFDFQMGNHYDNFKSELKYVRAVRTY